MNGGGVTPSCGVEMRSSFKQKFNNNRRIQKIARRLGIKLSKRNPKDSFMWDTKTIATGKMSISNVLHEIAHWLVADPRYRNVWDFGLGAGPETGRRNEAWDARKKSSRDRDDTLEETRASFLGIAFEAALGYDIRKTLKEHSWDAEGFYDTDSHSFWAIVHWLNERRLLRGHRPTALMKE